MKWSFIKKILRQKAELYLAHMFTDYSLFQKLYALKVQRISLTQITARTSDLIRFSVEALTVALLLSRGGVDVLGFAGWMKIQSVRVQLRPPSLGITRENFLAGRLSTSGRGGEGLRLLHLSSLLLLLLQTLLASFSGKLTLSRPPRLLFVSLESPASSSESYRMTNDD